jgi:hypothetical protein
MPKKRKPKLMTPRECLDLLRPADDSARWFEARRLGVPTSALADYAPYSDELREQFPEFFSDDAAGPRRGS